MSIKKELQKFYAKQGLQGKHLRLAIQWDMKAARRNYHSDQCNGSRGFGYSLSSSFIWKETPEGYKYWAARG